MTYDQAVKIARMLADGPRGTPRVVVLKGNGDYATCSPEMFAAAKASGGDLTVVEYMLPERLRGPEE